MTKSIPPVISKRTGNTAVAGTVKLYLALASLLAVATIFPALSMTLMLALATGPSKTWPSNTTAWAVSVSLVVSVSLPVSVSLVVSV